MKCQQAAKIRAKKSLAVKRICQAKKSGEKVRRKSQAKKSFGKFVRKNRNAVPHSRHEQAKPKNSVSHVSANCCGQRIVKNSQIAQCNTNLPQAKCEKIGFARASAKCPPGRNAKNSLRARHSPKSNHAERKRKNRNSQSPKIVSRPGESEKIAIRKSHNCCPKADWKNHTKKSLQIPRLVRTWRAKKSCEKVKRKSQAHNVRKGQAKKSDEKVKRKVQRRCRAKKSYEKARSHKSPRRSEKIRRNVQRQ